MIVIFRNNYNYNVIVNYNIIVVIVISRKPHLVLRLSELPGDFCSSTVRI